MKIGIMTFWWSEDNYGQLLQCYALQKYLRDNGHDAYLIRYDPRNDFKAKSIIYKIKKALNIKVLIKYAQEVIRNYISIKKEKNRYFSEFRQKYLSQSERLYFSYKDLIHNPPDADVYIVGSDQVWNFNFTDISYSLNLLNAYFLNFGSKKIVKMSYAASFGSSSLSKELIYYINQFLPNFSYISVREEKSVELLKNENITSYWVPDPTLLLHKKTYTDLFLTMDYNPENEQYILLYLLGNKCDFSLHKIKNFSNIKNLKLKIVTGNTFNLNDSEIIYPSIEHWLSLIYHSKFVITNSFHGSVFSYIFNKSFGVLKLGKEYSGMNERLDSLWSLLEIQPRYLLNNHFDILDTPYETMDHCQLLKKVDSFISAIQEIGKK